MQTCGTPEFQFHKGTIKTHPQSVRNPARFQFHKGTIKTAQRSDGGGCALDFNSIKVRLKQAIADRYVTLFEFQFHKGTIKTIV